MTTPITKEQITKLRNSYGLPLGQGKMAGIEIDELYVLLDTLELAYQVIEAAKRVKDNGVSGYSISELVVHGEEGYNYVTCGVCGADTDGGAAPYNHLPNCPAVLLDASLAPFTGADSEAPQK